MKSAAQVLLDQQNPNLDGHGQPRGRKSTPGGSGSLRAPRTPKASASSSPRRSKALRGAAAAAVEDSDEIDEVEAEEFRKRMKVVLT